MPDDTYAAADADPDEPPSDGQEEPPPDDREESPPDDREESPPGPPPAAPRPSHRRRQRIALIAGAAVAATAVAVTTLVLTASPARQYATPANVCSLVSPATVARYLPGPVRGKSSNGECNWSADKQGGFLVLVSVLAGTTDMRKAFTQIVQGSDKGLKQNGTTTTITGKQAVTGVGDQATALFEASTGPKSGHKPVAATFLILRSDNAIIQVLRVSPLSPAVSGPALLSGSAAIAREVIAAMPTLGPGSPGVGVHISLDVSHPVGDLVILGEPGRGDQHRGIAE